MKKVRQITVASKQYLLARLFIKLIAIFLMVAILPAMAQVSEWERQGLTVGPKPKKKTAIEKQQEKLKAEQAAAQKRLAQLNNPANYRVVDGKLYNAAFSTNWVDLPGAYRVGKFSRNTEEGPVFAIEHQVGGRTAGGYRDVTTLKFEREVLVKNYPGSAKIAGELMLPVRVLPISTTKAGIAVYDYGTPPKPVSGETNSAPAK